MSEEAASGTRECPDDLRQLQDLVRGGSRRLRFVGGGTKNLLVPKAAAEEVASPTTVLLRGFDGIEAYDPSEYTITVRAGTRVNEVQAALSEHGQFLPFDPLLVEAGSTIGGTVAAGISGPGRFAWGGIRDYVLEVRFVDGTGALVRGGGRVVKNAAGFDIPKLMVGSRGRFGPLVEVTFKVFPRPAASRTIEIRPRGDSADAIRLPSALRARLLTTPAPEALEVVQGPDGLSAVLRYAGTKNALERRVSRAAEALREIGETRVLPDDQARISWHRLAEFSWVGREAILGRETCTLSEWSQGAMPRCLTGSWVLSASQQVFTAISPEEARTVLETAPRVGLVRGPTDADFMDVDGCSSGCWERTGLGEDAFMRAICSAFDPHDRFA